jgi:hypothetical protein
MSNAGRRYVVFGTQNVASAADSTVGITGGTTIRPWIYDFTMGCSDTPADNALVWAWQRYTAAGTATAYTPGALDTGDPASTASAGTNHTAEPTYTAGAVVFYLPLNQRASHRVILDPNAPWVVPATANNGFGQYVSHSSFTGAVDCTVYFGE